MMSSLDEDAVRADRDWIDDARRRLKRVESDPNELVWAMGELTQTLPAVAERWYRRFYDPHRRDKGLRAPGYRHEPIRTLLDMLARPVARDLPEALDLLAEMAAELPCEGDRSLSESLMYAVIGAIMETNQIFSPAQQAHLERAAAREEIFPWGSRFWLKLAGLPQGVEACCEYIAGTSFNSDTVTVDEHVWLTQQVMRRPQEARGAFQRVLVTLYAHTSDKQRQAMVDALVHADGKVHIHHPDRLLHVISPILTGVPFAAAPDLVTRLARRGVRDVAPALIWLAEHGHASRLLEVVEGLGEIGGPEAEPALRRLEAEAWSPRLRAAAAAARDAVSGRDRNTSPIIEAMVAIFEDAQDPGGLTFRERQLADLAWKGATGDEEAVAALTAERKVEIVNAVQQIIARWAREGLTPDPDHMYGFSAALTRQAFDDAPGRLDALMAIIEAEGQPMPLRGDAIIGLRNAAREGRLPLTDAQRQAFADASRAGWGPGRRYELATLALPLTEAPWAEQHPRRVSEDELPTLAHAHILAQQPSEALRRCLSQLYKMSTPTQRRGLIRTLGPGHDGVSASSPQGWMPVWTGLLHTAAPATRRLMAEALERMGRATEVGGLTFVDTDTDAGALTLAEGGDVQPEAVAAHRAHDFAGQAAEHPIEALPPAPRRLPPQVWIARLLLGGSPWGGLWCAALGTQWWVVAGHGMRRDALTGHLIVSGLLLVCWLSIHALNGTWSVLRALRRGSPALGRVIKHWTKSRTHKGSTTTTYFYRLEYLTERGTMQTFTLDFGTPQPQLRDRYEPILYVADEKGDALDQIPVDALRYVHVRPGGRISVRPGAIFWQFAALAPWGMAGYALVM